ncbi:MAG: BamA/TamA family outer membrane protein [Desulfosalsimonadaceae bacterium]
MSYGNIRSSVNLRYVCCLVLAILLVLIADAGRHAAAEQPTGPVIDQIQIEIIGEAEKDAERWEKIARNLIFLEEGHPFSDARFSQSLTALNRSGLFALIDIPDPDWTEPPFTMLFRLKPVARIKNILISGGFPLLEREIINAMSIYTGDAYIPEKIDKQREYIEELFRTEGYIDPEVFLSAEKDPEDGHYVVHVDIKKGTYYRIDRVRVQGNENFSGKRLLLRLGTWQSSMLIGGATRLIDEELDEDKKTLQQFYWNRKFCEARVDEKVRLDEDRARAKIDLVIDEGPRYELTMTGNKAFWTYTLKKDLVIYEQGNIHDFGLRRSIRNIETRYRDAGYQDVRIRRTDDRYEENGQSVRQIELAIEEGPRYIVENVSIVGNKDVPTDRIKGQMLTGPSSLLHAGQFVPATLKEDIAAIESLYRQRGYLSPQMDTATETREAEDGQTMLVDVAITIQEGPRTAISDIVIENMDALDEADAMGILSLKPGDVHREHRIQESRNALAAKISEKGYPHVKIDTENIMSADQSASELIFRVDQGPYTEMGETFITGNFLTRRKTLMRRTTFEKGEPFSLSDMLESQRNIRNINALQTVRFQTIGLEEKADRVTLLAEVNEKKPYFFQFATGYDTSRLFYFNTGAGTINLLGRNKELRVFGEMSMIGYKGEIGYTEPNLFNTRIVADATVFTEETEDLNKNFGVRSTGATVNFSRVLTPDLSANLGFLYDHRDQYRTDDTPILPEDLEQYRSRAILVTTPGLSYNTTDSFVRPTKGVRTSASVGISKGIDNDLDDFLKYRITGRYYYTPARRLTLAVMGQAGFIDPYGDQDAIAEDQLFFLGGTMSVRGFSENRLRSDENRDPVGGRTFLMGSIEARYDLWRNFEIAVFYDTGTVRQASRNEGSNEWRAGAGVGLRYHTAIGPIGLMHGWKIDREEWESPGAYHFSIGYTF